MSRSQFKHVEGWNIRGSYRNEWKKLYQDAIDKLMQECSHPHGYTHWRLVFHATPFDEMCALFYIHPNSRTVYEAIERAIIECPYDIPVNIHTSSNISGLRNTAGEPAYRDMYQFSIFGDDLIKIFTPSELAAYESGIL